MSARTFSDASWISICKSFEFCCAAIYAIGAWLFATLAISLAIILAVQTISGNSLPVWVSQSLCLICSAIALGIVIWKWSWLRSRIVLDPVSAGDALRGAARAFGLTIAYALTFAILGLAGVLVYAGYLMLSALSLPVAVIIGAIIIGVAIVIGFAAAAK